MRSVREACTFGAKRRPPSCDLSVLQQADAVAAQHAAEGGEDGADGGSEAWQEDMTASEDAPLTAEDWYQVRSAERRDIDER